MEPHPAKRTGAKLRNGIENSRLHDDTSVTNGQS